MIQVIATVSTQKVPMGTATMIRVNVRTEGPTTSMECALAHEIQTALNTHLVNPPPLGFMRWVRSAWRRLRSPFLANRAFARAAAARQKKGGA